MSKARFLLVPATLIGLALAALGGAAIFIGVGAYNPGADQPHWGITTAVMTAVRERGIGSRVGDVEPPDLDDPALIRQGAGNYAAMCAGCHLAPGEAEGELQKGLYPSPPNLAEVDGLDPRETFWVIKHGIKMTGMPAWGKSMDNATIWGMTAFVVQLPSLTPEAYQALVASSGGHDHGGEATPDAHAEMAGMDHSGGEGTGASGGAHPHGGAAAAPMAGMDHGSAPMAGMDHGSAPMAGMDHGSAPMAGMDHGAMAGMDHGAMAMGGKPAGPSLRRLPGSAVDALAALESAMQVGNRDLALERLAPDLVVTDGDRTRGSRDEYSRSDLASDMEVWKNASVDVVSRQVQAGDRQAVVLTELRISGTAAGKDVSGTRVETVTLRRSAEGWKVSRIERAAAGAP